MKTLQLGRRQRGVGAVLVVMVLFFVVSLMAAYTSRNLIFEQKTSANQTRATMGFEAADAGIEWVLTQLNGGLINDSCEDTAPSDSFQRRYLVADADGYFTHTSRAADSWPTCVFNGTEWICRCPRAVSLTPPDSTGTGPFPAFRVWPATKAPMSTTSSPYTAVSFPRPALISVASAGCSVLPATANQDSTGGANGNCLSYMPRGGFGEGVGSTRVYLGLRSGLISPPTVALTARRTVTPFSPSAAKLKLVNTDQASGGFTVNTGDAVTASLFDARTIAGTPGPASFVDQDLRLFELNTLSTGPSPLSAGERMFVATFGMKRQAYRDQPGLRACLDPCTAAQINTLLTNNPNRIIWVEGNLTLDASIGAVGAPVLLIVNADTLTLASGVQIYGFVYLTGAASATSTINLPAGATAITGALVAEGSLSTAYASAPAAGQELTIAYDPVPLNLLRTTYGSWVRVPGGWRDFKE
jgi:hypothetical protein